MSPHADLGDLVGGAKGGDPASLEGLYERLTPMARNFLIQCGMGSQEVPVAACELAGDVLLAISQLRSADALRSFVWTLARRRAANWVNRAVRARRSVGIDEMVDADILRLTSTDTPEELLIQRERTQTDRECLELARRAIDRLPAADRDVIQPYLAGQSERQICRALKRTENAVYTSKSRGTKRLAVLVRLELKKSARKVGRPQ